MQTCRFTVYCHLYHTCQLSFILILCELWLCVILCYCVTLIPKIIVTEIILCTKKRTKFHQVEGFLGVDFCPHQKLTSKSRLFSDCRRQFTRPFAPLGLSILAPSATFGNKTFVLVCVHVPVFRVLGFI